MTAKFPIYIKASYDLWYSSIAGFNVLFARVKDSNIGMTVHYNAIKKMENICNSQVVLIFDILDSRNINRLIEKQISFIVKDKQIYMPFALMQLQTNKPLTTLLKKPQNLTPDADLILIGYLDGKINSSMIIKDIAIIINREVRATSIALQVLESLEYLYVEKQGRKKIVYFNSKDEIYEKLKLHGKSPIKYTFFTNSDVFKEKNIESGYGAISKFSMLVDNQLPVVAIGAKEFSIIENKIIKCEEENATCKVEVWDRDPSIFSIDGVINPIYIMRLFKYEDDERVEYALEEIEKKLLEKLGDK